MAEIARIWRWASTHERCLLYAPLVILAGLATAADLFIVADYLYDYARGLQGMGTSPVDALLGSEAASRLAPLVLLFLLAGIPGVLYTFVLVAGPPAIWLCRKINR